MNKKQIANKFNNAGQISALILLDYNLFTL